MTTEDIKKAKIDVEFPNTNPSRSYVVEWFPAGPGMLVR